MASYEPVIKNGAAGAIFYVALKPYTANGRFQTNPTLEAGDVTISGDGGAATNLATLPDAEPNGGKRVRCILSQGETNYDNISILFSDQTDPPEWLDVHVNIRTTADNFDTIGSDAAAILEDTGTTLQNELDGIQADTEDIQAKIGTPADLGSGATLAFNLSDIEAQTDDIASKASQTSVDDLPTNTELATALAAADDAVLAAIDALPTAAENTAAALTTQMTEAYAANGVAPTLAQALFAIHQMLMQFAISGTAISVKKLDNSTEAFEVTLNDATTPTSAVRT